MIIYNSATFDNNTQKLWEEEHLEYSRVSQFRSAQLTTTNIIASCSSERINNAMQQKNDH